METKRKKRGFTIVELLTVMAIIAILIGLLAPALNMVRRIAKDTRQKAQFHSIDAALEAYASEMEQYPDSNTLGLSGGGGPYTVGAQHLAEALIGRDFLGFDPWTTWNAQNDESDPCIYAAKSPSPKTSTDNEVTASLDRRKGPYLNPESVEAYQIAQLYATTDTPGNVYPGNLTDTGAPVSGRSPAPVLTDAYRVKTVSVIGKQVKAGTPILYYKANVTSREFNNSQSGTHTIPDACAVASIFNSMDNEQLLALGTIMNQSKLHNFDENNSGRGKFYDAITNPKITTQIRPYNQTSYILMSAGFDGIFGTPDDIYNFSQ
jgi:prepilin-type N-terminal cleavage/methylation domain-containing protein